MKAAKKNAANKKLFSLKLKNMYQEVSSIMSSVGSQVPGSLVDDRHD